MDTIAVHFVFLDYWCHNGYWVYASFPVLADFVSTLQSKLLYIKTEAQMVSPDFCLIHT